MRANTTITVLSVALVGCSGTHETLAAADGPDCAWTVEESLAADEPSSLLGFSASDVLDSLAGTASGPFAMSQHDSVLDLELVTTFASAGDAVEVVTLPASEDVRCGPAGTALSTLALMTTQGTIDGHAAEDTSMVGIYAYELDPERIHVGATRIDHEVNTGAALAAELAEDIVARRQEVHGDIPIITPYDEWTWRLGPQAVSSDDGDLPTWPEAANGAALSATYAIEDFVTGATIMRFAMTPDAE